ncbi:MAG: dihydropteroate synthase [Candidatus Caenarcaniphilales bacterium]|nr:dihydropteroate synthase [Candidatus Caenarcaniphilales bacterium]
MGILNITPDSFSDGGLYLDSQAAISRAYDLIEAGADIIDLGAESTRPGAEQIGVEEEWSRLEPVLEGLREKDFTLSLDTYKAEVLRSALPYGISYLNDVSGLSDPDMLPLIMDNPKLNLIINHQRGIPAPIANSPPNTELEGELLEYFEKRLEFLSEVNVSRDRIILDPGFGFGKGLEENLILLKLIPRLRQALNCEVLVGISRKRFVRELWGADLTEMGSVVLSQIALSQGAKIVRCHDPASFKPLKKLWQVLHSG